MKQNSEMEGESTRLPERKGPIPLKHLIRTGGSSDKTTQHPHRKLIAWSLILGRLLPC